MEKGDILTVAGGLFFVLIIALVANPHYLSGLMAVLPGAEPVDTPTPAVPVTVTTPAVRTTAVTATAATPVLPKTPVPPLRITYTDNPFTYPVVRLPERLDIYGGSDIRRAGEDPVTFAYLADSRGGVTRVFTVPYPVWSMDVRVFDNATPNVASFRIALCYAANGTVIEGAELIHPGDVYKKVQTSNVPLYLIVSTSGIDGFRIDFQTSREYFMNVSPMTTRTQGS